MKKTSDLSDSFRLPASLVETVRNIVEGFPPAKGKPATGGKKPFPPKKNESAAPGGDEDKPKKGFPSGQAPQDDSSVEIFQLQQQEKQEKEDAFKKEQEKRNKEEEKERKVQQQMRLKAEKEVSDDLDGKFNEDEDEVTMYPSLDSFADFMDEEDEDAEDNEKDEHGDKKKDTDDDNVADDKEESDEDDADDSGDNDERDGSEDDGDDDDSTGKKTDKEKKKVVKEKSKPKKKKSLKEERKVLAKQVKVGDWMLNPNNGERMARVSSVDQARANGYLVFGLADIQPRYKASFPNHQTSMHKGNEILLEATNVTLSADPIVWHAKRIYIEIGADVWGDETPDDDEFEDVIRDRLVNELKGDLLKRFQSLSRAEARKLILKAGP